MANKKIKLSAIYEMAKSRPDGYVDEYLRLGKVEGDNLIISIPNAVEMYKKYSPPMVVTQADASCQSCQNTPTSAVNQANHAKQSPIATGNSITTASANPSTPIFPPMRTMMKNALVSAGKVGKDFIQGKPILATPEVVQQRTEICDKCDKLVNNRCSVCGCNLLIKRPLQSMVCPLNKW
jgi:hypothetical protein